MPRRPGSKNRPKPLTPPNLPQDDSVPMVERTGHLDPVGAAAHPESCGTLQQLEPVTTPRVPATLDQAFEVLCAAVEQQVYDDMGRCMHLADIRAWYRAGHEPLAWVHVLILLQEILGIEIVRS